LAIVLFVLLCFDHWPKQRSTDNTMAKAKKYKKYNGQNKEVQTIQWPKQRIWPLYCLFFFALAIVLFVLLCFGHCIVCTSLFWPLYCLYFFVSDNTMAKTKKYRQYNGKNKEVQTIQWPKQRSTNNTMAKAKKNRQVLFVLLCFGHCIVCTSLFWPLYCLYFFVLAIVLFVLLCFGHCIVCTEAQTIQWPKQRRTDNTMAKTKKHRQYNGQNKEVQTIQ
jgi:flagellar hook-length control protein FliK